MESGVLRHFASRGVLCLFPNLQLRGLQPSLNHCPELCLPHRLLFLAWYVYRAGASLAAFFLLFPGTSHPSKPSSNGPHHAPCSTPLVPSLVELPNAISVPLETALVLLPLNPDLVPLAVFLLVFFSVAPPHPPHSPDPFPQPAPF